MNARPTPRNEVDAKRPYAWLMERERNVTGEVIDVATLFLTNRECPFGCVMCDLWKNTLTHSVAAGDIPIQIRYGQDQLARQWPDTVAREIKLYNSGNFFDTAAIPVIDHPAIADLVRGYDNVIVENHPKLCGDACLRFRDQVSPARLEIAMGLETCHEPTLKELNKSMTLADFETAVRFLQRSQIHIRAFLLHGLPGMTLEDSTRWTLRSIQYAAELGIDCVSVIPTRTGDVVKTSGFADASFKTPTGKSLEQIHTTMLPNSEIRVLIDLWDAESFFQCGVCRDERINRIQRMNLSQSLLPVIRCSRCDCPS